LATSFQGRGKRGEVLPPEREGKVFGGGHLLYPRVGEGRKKEKVHPVAIIARRERMSSPKRKEELKSRVFLVLPAGKEREGGGLGSPPP